MIVRMLSDYAVLRDQRALSRVRTHRRRYPHHRPHPLFRTRDLTPCITKEKAPDGPFMAQHPFADQGKTKNCGSATSAYQSAPATARPVINSPAPTSQG